MAKGDSAAIHVDFFRIQLELPRNGDRSYGESFIQLDAANRLRDDTRERLFAQALSVALAGDDEGSRAVVCPGRVSGRHGAIFFERRLELGKRFQRSVLAR